MTTFSLISLFIIFPLGIVLAIGAFWLREGLEATEDWPNTEEGREACKQATSFYELRSVVPMAVLGSEIHSADTLDS